MVLLVAGQSVEAEGLLRHPLLLAASERFLAQPASLPAASKCVYVCQGEEATVSASEDALLSTSDATTCIAAVLIGQAAAAAAQQAVARVVHHDEATTRSLEALQQTVAGLGQAAKLWLVGAYADKRGTSALVARQLLGFLQRCQTVFDVQLCCLDSHNTAPDGSPRSTALTVDLRSLAAFPTPPACRGPLLPARMAQWAYAVGGSSVAAANNGGSPLRSIYCQPAQQIQLTLLQGKPPDRVAGYCAWLLQLSDSELLSRWSTSPDHEPPHFVDDVRASFRWLLEQHGAVCSVTESYSWSADGWQPAEDQGQAAKAAGQVMPPENAVA